MSKQQKLFDSINNNKERIKILQGLIEYHQYLYFNSQPEISDEDFDKIWDELKHLDPNNEVFSKVGLDNDVSLNKIRHIIPMNSQEKVSSSGEFLKWARKMEYPKFIIQYKLDGISVELQYTKGKFEHGVTRGNGTIGDDITNNVRKMSAFVPQVNSDFSGAVRGEIVLTKDIFQQKYHEMKNCRNTASGITKRKDGKGSEDLTIISYDAVNKNPNAPFKNELNKLKWLETYNFNIVDTQTFKTPQEVVNYRDDVMVSIRKQLNYDIDGLVIKGNKIDLDDMKRARPMKQIAFKFDPEEIETILIDVEWSESGANYTPVAIVQPVEIAGTKVQRASLANPNLIQQLGAKIGSKVIVSKRGDIIPKIERVIENGTDTKNITIPHTCSTCETELINEGTRLYCPNEECPKRVYHRLTKWIKKLEVKNFGDLILKQLFNKGKVRKIADFYDLKVNDLVELDRVGEKSAQNALDNLFAVKIVNLARFVAGFNLENIAEAMVQKLVDAGIDTLEKLNNASVLELATVEGFGDITAQQFYKSFHSLYFDMCNVLNKNKIKIRSPKKGGKSMSKNKLEGQTFCFTGKLETMTRKEANQLVTENSGIPKSSVVSNLSYLVTNSIEQTSKYIKAQGQGTKIITEKEFLTLINK